MLYDKHKGIFAAEVDDVVGKFGQCLKGLQCSRMAALLRDVGDAITATSEPNFSFEAPIMDEHRGKENDAKAATEKTTDVKVVAPAKNASNEVKTTNAAAKASDAHVVALNSEVNAGTTSTTPAAAIKGSQAKDTENKLPQAGTDEKISLFASLAGLSIASLGLGALGASKKRKND